MSCGPLLSRVLWNTRACLRRLRRMPLYVARRNYVVGPLIVSGRIQALFGEGDPFCLCFAGKGKLRICMSGFDFLIKHAYIVLAFTQWLAKQGSSIGDCGGNDPLIFGFFGFVDVSTNRVTAGNGIPLALALMFWSYFDRPFRALEPLMETPKGLRAGNFRALRPLPAPCTPRPDVLGLCPDA
jgi:hypothetical protein